MSELRLTTAPPRSELLRQLAPRIRDVVPGWRALAEDVLGAESPIDFVGVEPAGRLVLVLVGEHGEDLALVARGMAQRAWVTPRARDWLKLAPGLGISPEAGIHVVLLCHRFGPEAQAAAHALGPGAMLLGAYRFVRNGSAAEPVVEVLLAPDPDSSRAEPRPPAAPAPFRTGVTDADLGLTDEERAEFE